MSFQTKCNNSFFFKISIIAIIFSLLISCNKETNRNSIMDVQEYAIEKIILKDSVAFLSLFELKSTNPFALDSDLKKRIILNNFFDAHHFLSEGDVQVLKSISPQNIENPHIFGSDPLKIAISSDEKIFVLTFMNPFIRKEKYYFRSFEFQQVFPEIKAKQII